MGRFTKRFITGLAAVLLVAGSAAAQVQLGNAEHRPNPPTITHSLLDNFEGGTGESRFGGYWYYYTNLTSRAYTSNPPWSAADRQTNLERITSGTLKDNVGTPCPPQWLFEAEKSNVEASGQPGRALILEYENIAGAASGLATGGDCSATNLCWPGVGVGIGISGLKAGTGTPHGDSFCDDAEDAVIPNNAFAVSTGIRFDFWQKESGYEVDFSVETSTQPGDAKYMIKVSGATGLGGATSTTAPGYTTYGEWRTITIPWSALDLPGWCSSTDPRCDYSLNIGEIIKLAWSVETRPSTAGEFRIDNIYILNYEHKMADECEGCAGVSLPAGATLFTNFDELMHQQNLSVNQNIYGGYWYIYNDAEARESSANPGTPSQFDDLGLWMDPLNPLFDAELGEGPLGIDPDNNLGYEGTAGAYIGFTMGTGFKDAKDTDITPFVGIGTNLGTTTGTGVDQVVNADFNGTTVQGFWFRYKTSAAIDVLYVEVEDAYNIANDDGEVFYTKLPGTGGQWQTAQVLFNNLVLPNWASNRATANAASLNRAQLAKLQFKYQGTTSGNVTIDDVYILGEGAQVGVRHVVSSRPSAASGIRATYNRGTVGVNWNAATQVRSGKISLVNVRGRTVASAPIKSVGNRITANLGAGRVPAGMYFVRVNARDINGKRIVQQVPITITK